VFLYKNKIQTFKISIFHLYFYICWKYNKPVLIEEIDKAKKGDNN
jgi:hypothetical protein